MLDPSQSAPNTKVPIYRACRAAVQFSVAHALHVLQLALPGTILWMPWALAQQSKAGSDPGNVYLVACLALAILGWAISSAAILRLALRPFFPETFREPRKSIWNLLAFGADEMRLVIVAAMIAIILTFVLVITLVVASVIAVPLQSSLGIEIAPPTGNDGRAMLSYVQSPGGLLIVAIALVSCIPAFWLFCRFSLAFCDTMTKGQIQIISATPFTRGNAWRIFACFVAVFVAQILVAFVLFTPVLWATNMLFARKEGTGPLSGFEVFLWNYIWNWLSWSLMSGLCAYLYQGLVPRMTPRSSEPGRSLAP